MSASHLLEVNNLQTHFPTRSGLVRAVDGEPPYAVEWADENPFERREIAVEAVDIGIAEQLFDAVDGRQVIEDAGRYQQFAAADPAAPGERD